MNIFIFLHDILYMVVDTICCIGCFEPEEILYDTDYITNYIREIERELEFHEKFNIH
jgi:hypothetical protein